MKGLLKFICLLLPIVIFAQPRHDYGDAPDTTQFARWWGGTARFHTLRQSGGPYHTQGSASTFWIGRNNTRPTNTTTHEVDALVIDNDQDDGQPFIFVLLVGIPAPATVSVPITTSPAHNPNQEFYVNVLIDVDNDLDFDNFPDPNWVVKNQKIKLPRDTSVWVTYGGFGFGGDLLLFPVWLRVTLTTVPVPHLWIGKGPSGGWTLGETEDWWYTFGGGGGGRRPPPGGGGNNPRGSGPSGGGGGGNPGGKSHSVSMPHTVYVKCDETKCFTVTINNNGSQPMTDVNCGFSFSAGTPLPQGPTHVPPPEMPIGAIPPGGSVTLTFCITGWPCLPPGEGNRWARYTFHINYDPDGEYVTQSFDIDLRSSEDPFINAQYDLNLGLVQTCGSDATNQWNGKIGEQFRKCLTAFNGLYQFGGRWIAGRAVIQPIYMPAWLNMVITGQSADSTHYEFSGVPGIMHNGWDSLVVQVVSDNPTDVNFKPYIVNIPIIIENINNPPKINKKLPDELRIDICRGDSIESSFEVIDEDLAQGRKDTIFIDYYLKKEGNNELYFPENELMLADSGNGRGYVKWIPQESDTGRYEFWIITWDYYYGFDSAKCEIEVVAPSMKAEFTADKQMCYLKDEIKFTDMSSCSQTKIKYWLWEFGDGNTSTSSNPIHKYENKGLYSVKLTISDGTSSTEKLMLDYIRVLDSLKVAFTSDTASGFPPLDVNFTDLSSGEITKWNWDFGDSDASAEKNPKHTYTKAGKYSVKLEVNDPLGSLSDFKQDYINVIDPSHSDDDILVSTVSVYPQPATSGFFIALDLSVPAEISVDLYDVLGSAICRMPQYIANDMRQIIRFDCSEDNSSGIQSGIYWLRIKIKSGNIEKVIDKAIVIITN